MGVNQTYTCDCCSEEMPDSSVLSCVIVTRLEETGDVVQHYFCRAFGCAKALNDAVDALPDEHSAHAEVPAAPVEPPAQDPPAVESPAVVEDAPTSDADTSTVVEESPAP